jgi:hypothetical protein
MLGWALTFLVIALIAAVLGFGGIAGSKLPHGFQARACSRPDF